VLEANWLAPIPRPLMLIGRTMANLLITTLTSLVTLFLAALLFGLNITGSVLPALGAILPMLIGLYGFGFAFAALVLVLREANTLVDVSSFLVQIFAGANFPVSALPRWMLPASLILPLTYGYDAARGFLLNTRTILPIHIEIVILIVGMFFFVTFGLWAFRRLERGVRIRGTFNQY
jgi:ABC-2 type transport system permease protein